MCNLVYVLLVQNLDRDERATFDEELYAPLEGWEKAERDMWEQLDQYAGG